MAVRKVYMNWCQKCHNTLAIRAIDKMLRNTLRNTLILCVALY
ncbi:uncharacterized protein CTRU02_207847 [Colletotrichum truncatum]|uniref:Uncharacterized protein n=1 Tax=Colletotrichum truncatum TaxID=5467 RepID=A0ACC3Z201_COLTU|nr:uncharacterized protein CTRU02_15569 [Colletotrichum truncatum]KAF6780912.1 hypothetical protein CTRU02_15569 [Colletotrichum truncatum]